MSIGFEVESFSSICMVAIQVFVGVSLEYILPSLLISASLIKYLNKICPFGNTYRKFLFSQLISGDGWVADAAQI